MFENVAIGLNQKITQRKALPKIFMILTLLKLKIKLNLELMRCRTEKSPCAGNKIDYIFQGQKDTLGRKVKKHCRTVPAVDLAASFEPEALTLLLIAYHRAGQPSNRSHNGIHGVSHPMIK